MAVRRRARRLFGLWRAERRTLRQGLVALALSTAAAFVAGLTLSGLGATLERLPGLLVLIPAAVGMRGTIFGAVGARLGTATHAGTFEANLARGGVLRQNVEVSVISTFASSLWLAALATLIASAFGNSISFWDMVTISVVGGALSSAIILLVTVGLSVLSFRRGYDLDAVSTPMVTAIGDMATLPTLFLATFLTRSDTLNAVVAGLCLVACVYAVARGLRDAMPAVRRVLLEMVGVLALAPILDIFAGALLEANKGALLRVPGVLILIPPFVSQAGALGGIMSSRLSSKLQLGVITPRGRPETPAIVDGTLIVAFGAAIFTAIGTAGWGLSELFSQDHPGIVAMIGGTIIAGALVLPITLVLGYYIAILTARSGLDPDNHGVPIITSSMDLAGVACILFAMSLLGATVHG
jgi:mgtE-like transporter